MIFENFRCLMMVILVLSLFLIAGCEQTQNPIGKIAKDFENEEKVNIIGYNESAMEPFISRDGKLLFFNSLNDAKDTSLYYAKWIKDNNFQFIGKVENVNGKSPHLDAVASMDIENNFYFISTREYPKDYRNVFAGIFDDGIVTNLHRVEGNFYIEKPRWVIMDAEISPNGKLLFFVNARFEGGPLPVESDIGIAIKETDGSFVVDKNSAMLLKNINTKDLEYAPSFSVSGLELYFTRMIGSSTKIYVAKRNSLSDPFGIPELIEIEGDISEAASISMDGKRIYYHKFSEGEYSIYKMIRD